MRLDDTKITKIDGYIVLDIALHPCDAKNGNHIFKEIILYFWPES